MAIGLSGCVIVEQDTRTGMMRYKKKCEFCGYIEGGGTLTRLIKSGTLNSSFICLKCKKRNPLIIKG